MATHSSTLAQKIPWLEEPGGLQSVGSQRVGHDWATSLSFCLSFFLSYASVCKKEYHDIEQDGYEISLENLNSYSVYSMPTQQKMPALLTKLLRTETLGLIHEPYLLQPMFDLPSSSSAQIVSTINISLLDHSLQIASALCDSLYNNLCHIDVRVLFLSQKPNCYNTSASNRVCVHVSMVASAVHDSL